MGRISRGIGIALAAVVVGTVLAPAGPAGAWPGDLDGTFGDCGVSSSVWPGITGTPEQVLADPDGRIWMVTEDASMAITVLRYLPDGRLDPTFGDAGIVRAGPPFNSSRPVVAALTPDGGIVVAADNDSTGYPMHRHSRFWHILADGTSWWGLPKDLWYHEDPTVRELVIQADGSLVMLVVPGVVRFDSDGLRDWSFGGDGVIGGTDATALAARPDGSLVVSDGDGVSLYSKDGQLDTEFGAGGTAAFSAPGWGSATSLAIDPAGNIVGLQGTNWLTTFRVTASGELDTTFGGDGVVSYGSPSGWGWWDGPENSSLTVDASGRPVVGTLVFDKSSPPGTERTPILKLVRFAASSGADPGLDPDFGFGGVVYSDALPAVERFFWTGSVVASGNGLFFGAGPPGIPTLVRFESDGAEAPAGYTLSGWGSLHPWASSATDLPPCAVEGPYWPGWDIARGVTTFGSGTGGYVLSGWGSLHPYTPYPEVIAIPPEVDGPYWPGWDIARDVALDPFAGGGGVILSGWGSLHPFTLEGGGPPPRTVSGPYWYGWDIARGVAYLPDGLSGYVLDGWGGLHPFVLEGGTAPPPVSGLAYWPGWDIARGVTLLPDGTGGHVVDGWGGLHPFGVGSNPEPATPTIVPYWAGWDIVEGLTVFEVGAEP